MADLAALTQAAQQSTPDPHGAAGLAALVKASQQRPVPTHAQTVAGLHRFREVEMAVAKVMQSPDVGKKNVRPAVLDMGADLVGRKVMTMAEFMSALSSFPPAEDFLAQKKWLERAYQSQIQGQMTLLQDHARAGEPTAGTPEWSPDSHDEHMTALKGGYKV